MINRTIPSNMDTASQMAYYQQDSVMQQQVPSSSNVLFVADLPDECCEEDLANFFKAYNFFLAKVIHNIMRTHAFVHFQSREDAEKARNELNGVKICPKYSSTKVAKPVRLCKYEAKTYLTDTDERCNLLIKNLSKDFSAHMMFNTFKVFGDIRSSKLMIDYMGNSKGFGFVSFYKVDDAIKAKNALNDKEFNGKPIKVDYLEKGRSHLNRKNNIYVKYIPKKQFDNKDLEELFKPMGQIKSAIVLKDDKGESKGFGFVCFDKPEDADRAFKEMNNKHIFDDIDTNLYVSFALKKGERQEQLLKKREEMFKMSQKMTIYAKIKDESSFTNEAQFTQQILHYITQLLRSNYVPKHIKAKFDTKNAFITMNTQKDAEDFVHKFQDFSKEHSTNIFFSIYKSKIDRINATALFKKYNQFSETSSIASGALSAKYKNYNDFSTLSKGPHSTMTQGHKPTHYNIAPQKQFINYNNFDMLQSQPQQPQPVIRQQDNQQLNKEEFGEAIYEVAYNMYGEEASKITGMLLELTPAVLTKMLSNMNDMKFYIDKGHNELNK